MMNTLDTLINNLDSLGRILTYISAGILGGTIATYTTYKIISYIPKYYKVKVLTDRFSYYREWKGNLYFLICYKDKWDWQMAHENSSIHSYFDTDFYLEIKPISKSNIKKSIMVEELMR